MTVLLQKLLSKASLIFLVLLILIASSVVPTFAQSGGAKVYLQPVAATKNSLTVDVVAENAAELYGVEFKLKYDPAVVSVVDANPEQQGIQIDAGNFLPSNQGFVVINQANPDEGTILFAMTLLNPAPAVSGTGPLAQVSFDVLQAAPSTIDIADAKLVAVSLQIIPAELTGLTIGEENATPGAPVAADSSFPWWVVAAGIIIFGLIGLGVFMAMGVFTPSKTQKPSTRPGRQSGIGQRS